ncbi:MAG: hypothetical protein M1305_06065 [Candidatus Marsarchaeota archaeon]|nr:hypothetical protein [Candidatus Marsarchaeota archaeon]
MTETNHIIAYVDESSEELNQYQELLQGSGLVTVKPVKPHPNVVETLSELDSSLILIDYVLDEARAEGPQLEYRGGLVAAAARQKYPQTTRSCCGEAEISADPHCIAHKVEVCKDGTASGGSPSERLR